MSDEDFEQEYVWVEDRRTVAEHSDIFLPHLRYNEAGHYMPLQSGEAYLSVPLAELNEYSYRIMISGSPNSATQVATAQGLKLALFFCRAMNKERGITPREPSKIGYDKAVVRALYEAVESEQKKLEYKTSRLTEKARVIAESIERREQFL